MSWPHLTFPRDLPATLEVLLQTDAGKHILDAFLGQGRDALGQASALGMEDVAHSMDKAVPNLDKYISFALFTVFLRSCSTGWRWPTAASY